MVRAPVSLRLVHSRKRKWRPKAPPNVRVCRVESGALAAANDAKSGEANAEQRKRRGFGHRGKGDVKDCGAACRNKLPLKATARHDDWHRARRLDWQHGHLDILLS